MVEDAHMTKFTKPPTDADDKEGRWRKGGSAARLEQSEREERSLNKRKLRSAYLSIVGENPDLIAGHSVSAHAMLARIKQAWKQRRSYTPAERDRLSALRTKWEKRAAGEDARFNMKGTKRGRPTKDEGTPLVRTYTCVKGLKTWVEKEEVRWSSTSYYMRRRMKEKDGDRDRGDS